MLLLASHRQTKGNLTAVGVEGRARQPLQDPRTRGCGHCGPHPMAAAHVHKPIMKDEAIPAARTDQRVVVLGPEQGTATIMARGRGQVVEKSQAVSCAAWRNAEGGWSVGGDRGTVCMVLGQKANAITQNSTPMQRASIDHIRCASREPVRLHPRDSDVCPLMAS
jgi:hypothetical protein